MNRFRTSIGAALLALASPNPAAAQPAAGVAPSEAAIAAARTAVGNLDFQRIGRDRDYAAQLLGHLDLLASVPAIYAEGGPSIEVLRLYPLMGLERADELRATIDRLLAMRPDEAAQYEPMVYASLAIEDFVRFTNVVEAASRNVRGSGWAALRAVLDREFVGPVLHQLDAQDKPARVRLASALFRIGWPGGDDAESSDSLRAILMEDRMSAGDVEAASGFAAGISTPANLLPMLVQARYDRILAPGRDRLALLRESLTERDRVTNEALSAAPQDQRRVLDRVQHLRSIGRDADALALIVPFTRDIRATVAAGEFGMWLINEGAYAQLALDRPDEAVALMRRLVALPLSEFPGLIGPSINYAEILIEAGRREEGLAHARGLETNGAEFANDYGRAWISSAIVCSLVGMDRASEAAPVLALLRAQSEVNEAAVTRAMLCAGDTDGAAALMVRRLGGDEAGSAILALQDYTLSKGNAQEGPLYDRLTALREHPEVSAALASVGRVMSLPLARTYWGAF
jgi:hypothetical protein